VNILTIDQNLLLAINHLVVGKSAFEDSVVKFCAVYLVYTLPIGLVYLWIVFKKQREALFLSFLGTILTLFTVNKFIIPAIWLRPRPDLSAIGANELLFHRPDYSFPSDHATALFGIAFGLYIFGFKKAANWFLIIAIITAFARVAVGVHFPLDIVGGAVSGLVGVSIVYALKGHIVKYIYKPLLKILKKVRLA
jgi:undecaprenyl-diphosphatase